MPAIIMAERLVMSHPVLPNTDETGFSWIWMLAPNNYFEDLETLKDSTTWDVAKSVPVWSSRIFGRPILGTSYADISA